MLSHKPKIVVVGGGTGTSVVCSGLKQHDIDLTAIVTVADSGGSTGRLRDQFGFQPVGDLRQSLAALARESDQSWIRELLLYRFKQGDGLKGHNLGNLILTALQDLSGSTPKALEIAGKVFFLEGNIYPITNKNVDLVIEYTDGTFIIGEHYLNPENGGGKKIKKIRLSPQSTIYSKAKNSILNADMIVIGPGDLYASVLPNFVVSGSKKAFSHTKAKIVYIVNLMTRYTQTHDFTAKDHVEELKKYLGKYPDYVIVNNAPIPKQVLKSYELEKGYPVKNDLERSKYQVIEEPLALIANVKQNKADAVKRSLLLHNKDRLTKLLLKLLDLSI
jgi:uncharacterized cofD-like protein